MAPGFPPIAKSFNCNDANRGQRRRRRRRRRRHNVDNPQVKTGFELGPPKDHQQQRAIKKKLHGPGLNFFAFFLLNTTAGFKPSALIIILSQKG